MSQPPITVIVTGPSQHYTSSVASQPRSLIHCILSWSNFFFDVSSVPFSLHWIAVRSTMTSNSFCLKIISVFSFVLLNPSQSLRVFFSSLFGLRAEFGWLPKHSLSSFGLYMIPSDAFLSATLLLLSHWLCILWKQSYSMSTTASAHVRFHAHQHVFQILICLGHFCYTNARLYNTPTGGTWSVGMV